MFNRRRKILLLATLTLALAGPPAPAAAQYIKGLDNNSGGAAQPSVPSGEGASQFLLEPEVQIKGDNIKQQTYRSEMVGQNKNWDLDIGRFQPPLYVEPRQSVDPQENENYSGMRLRLPFRGRTGP